MTIDVPFQTLGGETVVRAIVERFYDAMHEVEPALARLHSLDGQGHVDRATRDRFALFFIGWLGGPQDYRERHGHPRLRMRHAHLPVDDAMVAAWLRCMTIAFDHVGVKGEVRGFLDARLTEVAGHLRNRD